MSVARKTRPSHGQQSIPARGVRKWLTGHRQVARSSLQRLVANPLSSALTVFVIAVSLLLPALLLTLDTSLNMLLAGLGQETQISVYLQDTVTEDEGLQVSNDLLTYPGIEAVDYISSAEALAEFSLSSGLGEVLSELPDNPLPITLLVTPGSADPDAVSALAARLAELPQVAFIQVDSQWLRRLEALSRLLSVGGSLLSLVVLLGLFVIVGNTIKLAIENRRQEILVIKLVGGTDSFIARPFLYSGWLYGCAGGILAVALQALVLAVFNAPLQELLGLYESTFELPGVSLAGAAGLVLAGATIGWLAALFASLRYILALDP